MTDFTPNCTCFLDGHEMRGELGVISPPGGRISVQFTVDDGFMINPHYNVSANKYCVMALIPIPLIRPDETVTTIQIGWKTASLYYAWFRWLYRIPIIRRRSQYPYYTYPVYTGVDSFQWYDHPNSQFFRRVKGLE